MAHQNTQSDQTLNDQPEVVVDPLHNEKEALTPLRNLIVAQGSADMVADEADKQIDKHFEVNGLDIKSYQLRSLTSSQVKAIAKRDGWEVNEKQVHSALLRFMQSGYIEGAINKIKGGSRVSKAIVKAFLSCEGKSKDMEKILTDKQYAYYQHVWIANPNNQNPVARSSFNRLLTKVELIEKNALKESLQSKEAQYSEEELVGRLTTAEKALRASLKVDTEEVRYKKTGEKLLEKIRKNENPVFNHAKAVQGLNMFISAFDRDLESKDS
jgi:hypothetical protein